MPLQNQLPIIDDRTFEEIVDEARARIPRYTPEWTDQNDSDLGMTLVQLFAWLTEMQIYRMSKLPRLNYIKFLELIGIELEPAKAATARIGFPVLAGAAEPYIIVPARTQIAAVEPDDDGPILFEIEQALTAIRAKLDRLQAFDGLAYREISRENDDVATGFEPFGHLASDGSALLLGFNEALPPVSFGLTFWVELQAHALPVLQCTGTTLQPAVSAELAWEFWNGGEWRRLDILADDTLRLTRSGEVRLTGPPAGDMAATTLGKSGEPRYWVRARVERSGYERAPRLLAVRTNTVLATQAETIEFEIVGGSDAQVEQVVTLGSAPVLAGSLELQVDEGAGYQNWEERPDLFGSGPDDAHYVLNRATGEIRFGDGVHGRIPVANPRNPANFRALRYRVGGGTRGNLPAASLSVPQTSLPGIDANGVSNLFAAAGGADEESFEAARRRAPQALKSRERAVTAEDFELLAVRAANIARAKALPLYHPKFPGVEVPGVISVILVPDVDTAVNPAPVPSQGTLQTVCRFLDDRRLMTTEVYVIGPRYQEVVISAELVVADDADLAAVKTAVLEDLARYFDPIAGGEDSSAGRDGSGWPFGGDIFYSLLYKRLLIDGVKRVISLGVALDGEEYQPCTDVPVDAGVLLSNGAHVIKVRYE